MYADAGDGAGCPHAGDTRAALTVDVDDLADSRLGARLGRDTRLPGQLCVGPEGQDDLPGLERLAVFGAQLEGVVARLAQVDDFAFDDLRPSPRRLKLAVINQVRTSDALGKAEMVVDHGSPRHARVGVDQYGLQTGAASQGCGAGPGRAAAYDRDVVHREPPESVYLGPSRTTRARR